MTRARGFTLLELLIALSIFAVLAVLTYGGLRTVLEARTRTEAEAQRLAAVQMAFTLLGRDLVQAIDRPARSGMGDNLPALAGSSAGDPPLELTRGGWSNPTGAPRADLQRIGWRLEERTLLRESWQVLDRAQDSAPFRAPIVTGVNELKLRFLDTKDEWGDSWPPLNAPRDRPVGLPRAVEFTLVLPELGPLRRIYPLPERFEPVLATGQGENNGSGKPGEQKAPGQQTPPADDPPADPPAETPSPDDPEQGHGNRD